MHTCAHQVHTFTFSIAHFVRTVHTLSVFPRPVCSVSTVHTKICLSTLVHGCTHCAHLIHSVHTLSIFMYIQLNHHRFLLMAGPLWYNQRTGEVLKASRRYNNQGKTGGDLAASLQLNVWMRAEEPGILGRLALAPVGEARGARNDPCGSAGESFVLSPGAM